MLLVQLHCGQWRAGGGDTAGQSSLAARFTALVEAHFRDRWTVARYAQELGISRDRPNDICRRAHGRPSERLVRDRLALEAPIYLESSSLTLDQIAAAQVGQVRLSAPHDWP